MNLFSRAVLRWAGTIALLGTLLAGVGGYYSVQLFKNLRTDIEELLPTSARSVIDLNQVTRRLESIDNLAVLVFSQHPDASKRFVTDLAKRLEALPRSEISSVEYRIDRELEFFRERRPLYMELGDLEKVREYIRKRIDFEIEQFSPANFFQGFESPAPRFDFGSLRGKYERRVSSYSRFPGGFYATPDGKIRVVLAYLPGKTSSIDQTHHFKHLVEKAIADLNPKSYAPDLEIKYTGGVQDTLEEHAALIADLELSTVVVVILVALAMLIFYRTFRGTTALVASIFGGTLWTFGLSYFVVGYLNANSAFLGSIVIGNGINFGIILLARYMEERRKRRGNYRALRTAMTRTATSTWTAALAAALAYGSLMLTSFRGFNQFGIIGLIGMLLCWLSAYTLLPAYLTVIDRVMPIRFANRRVPGTPLANGVAALVGRFPGAIWTFSIVATVLSLATFLRFDKGILENNLSNLRNKESMEHGSAHLSKNLDEIFQRYLSPMVILPQTRGQAREIAARLKERKAREGESTLIASVQTLDDFVPQDQARKVQVLREIRHLLPPRMVAKLGEAERQLVHEFLNERAFRTMSEKDLPPLVLNKFTERDKSVGKMVLVEPPLTNATWEGENLFKFITELRNTADAVAPGTPVAGTLPITADIFMSVARDGPRATLFALLAVVILVIVLFRNFQASALTLFALGLGVVWLGGIILGFWFKINFLNFIALPITFGIGVDYGVNIFQRYREEGGRNILDVIRNTGGAVGLASFTTITGYSSLLIAGNQGFVSFGQLAVAGELTCVFAAVVALPAFLLLRHRRRLTSKEEEGVSSFASRSTSAS